MDFCDKEFSRTTVSTRAVAGHYRDRGFVPIPVASGDKKPIPTSWQTRDLQTPLDDFCDSCNIGIQLGDRSGGLVDIDLDCLEAISVAPYFLAQTGMKFGRPSNLNSHWLYRVTESGKMEQFSSPRGGMLVEYRANGGYTVFPPSIHPSGEEIWFSEDGEPAEVSREDLIKAVRLVAASSLLATVWKSGTRHHASMALAGGLLRAGWKHSEIEQFLRAICHAAKDEEVSDRVGSISTTLELLGNGQPATGWPELANLLGDDIVKSLLKWLGVDRGQSDAPVSDHKQQALQTDEWSCQLTESANADRFAEQHRNKAAFCAELDTWFAYGQGHWHRNSGLIRSLAEDTGRSIFKEVAEVTDSRRREHLITWARKSCSRPGIDNMVALAEHKLPIKVLEFDKDPYLLSCKNGTIDLRTGRLRSHRPQDWLTKQVPYDFDPNAQCPRFIQFLEEITNRNLELTGFIQRALGYSLTGDTGEQCFFIAYGEGANGKSTLMGLFRELLGDYGHTAALSSFIQSRPGGTASPDLVQLEGKRFVTTMEAEANQRLADSLLKQLTGGDVITVRPLYKEPISFKPVPKIWMATNHKPKVPSSEEAMWRRIYLVPFLVSIAPEKRDPKLQEKLKAEAPGILAWAVRGCLEWQSQGLNPPGCVRSATEKYKEENDDVSQFLADCTETGAHVSKARMFGAYQRWAKDNGAPQVSMRDLYALLIKAGLEDGRSDGVRVWRNVKLIEIDLGPE